MAEVVILEIPLQDLEFKVEVPAGSRIVAALETPSGQLIRLDDLSVEQGGVPVKDLSALGGTGPVVEERVKLADNLEPVVRDVAREMKYQEKEILKEIPWPDGVPAPATDVSVPQDVKILLEDSETP